MSKKITAKKVGKQVESNVKALRVTAQELWLASLGAASLARKQGLQIYGSLVQEGKSLQQKSVALAETVGSDVRKQVEGVVGKVMTAANDNASYVEARLGEGVSRVLHRMGVPSREDIVELSKRVAELSKQVKQLQNGRKSTLLGDIQAA